MARTVQYIAQRLEYEFAEGELRSELHGNHLAMPAIVWKSGALWLDATAYLRSKAWHQNSIGGSQQTVASHAFTLTAYANFLEVEKLSWCDFSDDRSPPTYRFRGHVLRLCDERRLARSTAAKHMGVLRQFYEWAQVNFLVDRASKPYRAKQVAVRFTDNIGLSHSKLVRTSDLAIRAPRAASRAPEDGAHPIRLAQRDQLLSIAANHFRAEFNLVLKLGFLTGMRIGTIIGLTYSSLRNCFPSRELPGWYSIEVGPKAGIPTKGGVSYYPSIPKPLLAELLNYCKLPRRALRQRNARLEDRDLVFLNFRGKRMTSGSFSADMTKLRRLAKAQGMRLANFHFHCSRATFGTAFVITQLDRGLPSSAILPRLMALMGHSRADTSLAYIAFIENDQLLTQDAIEHANYLGLPDQITR